MKPSRVSSELRRISTKINNSTNVNPEAVKKDLRRIVAALTGDQKAAEAALYNPEHYRSQVEGKPPGSSIWWYAFQAAGILDWTPFTDYEEVEAAMKEAAKSWPNPSLFTEKDLRSLKRNWEDYQKDYMPEHIEILKSKGIIDDSNAPPAVG